MKHTFVICAYKNSPYVEECMQSLKAQSVPSELILATATPSEKLKRLCEKYEIAYQVREGQPGIAPDWNFALSLARTPYVTIAHQDDIYHSTFVEEVVERMELEDNPLLSFTDYNEIRNGEEDSRGRNLAIKRLLLLPLRLPFMKTSRFGKRLVLRFGNAICCPSVTYGMRELIKWVFLAGEKELFHEHFRSNLDWETWEWLSRQEGAFLYIPKKLMAHRIHADSETTATIKDNQRQQEDYEMFCKFWPKCIAKRITRWYGKSEEDNEV